MFLRSAVCSVFTKIITQSVLKCKSILKLYEIVTYRNGAIYYAFIEFGKIYILHLTLHVMCAIIDCRTVQGGS